ncbi:hypothetical protein EB796_025098 [Bugula neritina]|uniref:Uncharacterized protein n=1 Tax=Bugula neritina TaxID=10212 RepID=A0A7J7IST5_BUGNE|nr:hypothetical protein EB796_025098 [Bugula neritina]
MDCCTTFQLIFYFLVLTNSLTQFEVQGQTVGSPVQDQGRSRGSRSRGPRTRGGGSPVDVGSMVVANRGVRRNEPLDIKFSDQWETQSYSESAYGTSIKDGEVVSGPLKSGKEKIEPLPSGRKRRPAKGKFTEFQIKNFDDFVQFDEPLVTEAPVSNLNVDFSMMDTDVDNADPTFNGEKVLEPEIPVHQEFSVPEVARTSLSPPTVRTPPRPQFQPIEIDTGNVDNSRFTTQAPQMIRYPWALSQLCRQTWNLPDLGKLQWHQLCPR